MVQGGPNALVIFSSRGDAHWLSGLLHQKYKHVWCAIKERDYWVSYDWLDGRVQLRVEASADFDLESHYRSLGHAVIPLRKFRRRRIRWMLMVNNCVGHTKLICGINSRALTPYGLYKHLTRGYRHASLPQSTDLYAPRRQRRA